MHFLPAIGLGGLLKEVSLCLPCSGHGHRCHGNANTMSRAAIRWQRPSASTPSCPRRRRDAQLTWRAPLMMHTGMLRRWGAHYLSWKSLITVNTYIVHVYAVKPFRITVFYMIGLARVKLSMYKWQLMHFRHLVNRSASTNGKFTKQNDTFIRCFLLFL